MSNRSTPTVSPTSSFSQPTRRLNVDHAARQRSYLDEKRRQKAMYPQQLMMGGGAGGDHNDNDNDNDMAMGMDSSMNMMDNSHRSMSGQQSSNRSLSHSYRSSSHRQQHQGHHQGSSSSTNFFDEPSEHSESYHDPLHITAVGMDPTNAKASATSMSRKFFLTPPERLSVDQSVNLMDVETGHYDLPTGSDKDYYYYNQNRRRSSRQQRNANNNNNGGGGGIFSNLMASYSQTPPPPSRTSNNNNDANTSSTSNSFTQFFTKSFSPSSSTTTTPATAMTDTSDDDDHDVFDAEQPPQHRRDSMTSVKLNNVSEASSKHSARYGHHDHDQQLCDLSQITSHSRRKASHKSFVEAFLDEELGKSERSSSTNSSHGAKRRRRRQNNKKKNNDKNATAATDTPNKVEFPEGYDPNEWERLAVDAKSQPLLPPTDVDTVTHSNKNTNNKKKTKKLRWGGKTSRRSTTHGGGEGRSRRRRLRVGRLALVLGILFLIILIVLIVLIATGETVWYKFHQPSTAGTSTPSIIIERNHSYLDVKILPTSTQMLLLQAGHVQYKSPQQKALEWLEQDPKTTVGDSATSTEFIISNGTVPSTTPLDSQGTTNLTSVNPLDSLAALQKFVLATLYYATGGPDQWTDPEHWMDIEYNECDWFGVEAKYNGDYSVCNRYHQLHAILLHGHGLTGRLPTEEMMILSNLKHLDVGNNSLTGIVPGVWFEAWRNLEYFDIQGNSFVGQLPSELGLLSNSNGLRELNFRSNQFTGTIPTELGGLINHLDVLQLGDNRLTGTIPPQLGGLLPTGGRQLGEEDNSEYYHHRELERLSLHGNDLTGRIPSQLGLLTLLTELELHHLKLDTQDMPQEICDLPALTRLTVDCDAVTCPKECGCTCVDPLPAPTSVSGGWMAAESGIDLSAKHAEARPKHKIHAVSGQKKEEEEEEAPAATESKTSNHAHHIIHKVTKEAPNESGTKSEEEEEVAESETRTVHRPANHFIHKINTNTEEEEDKKKFDSESITVHRPSNHFVHKITKEAEEEEPENELRTVSAPNHFVHEKAEGGERTVSRPQHYVHPVSKDSEVALPEAAEKTDPEPDPRQHHKIHMITNDMAPSPAQGELDLPPGDFVHAEGITIQKRPVAQTQPKQQESINIAPVTVKHRPSNRRFLRPSRDSL